MGIVHFAPVGTRPGAVTSALAYLKNNQKKFTGFKGQIIESIVVFASPEVRNGRLIVKECFNNEYGSRKCSASSWKNLNVLNIIKKFIEKGLADIIPSKGSLSVCTVIDPNDYDDCFEKIAKAILKFSAGPEVGKHIWANLTGGTNILNSALFEVALLSGRIGKLYYTFLSDIKAYGDYLQPPSTEKTIFDWREVPFTKINFDESYYQVLETLKEVEDWCEDEQCFNRLKNKNMETFLKMNITKFKRVYLNPMHGRGEIERLDNKNRLSQYGGKILDRIRSPLFKTLIEQREQEENERLELVSNLNIEELWIKE